MNKTPTNQQPAQKRAQLSLSTPQAPATAQVDLLATSQVGALSTSTVEQLTTSTIAALTTSDVAALMTSTIEVLSTSTVDALAMSDVAMLSTSEIGPVSDLPVLGKPYEQDNLQMVATPTTVDVKFTVDAGEVITAIDEKIAELKADLVTHREIERIARRLRGDEQAAVNAVLVELHSIRTKAQAALAIVEDDDVRDFMKRVLAL